MPERGFDDRLDGSGEQWIRFEFQTDRGRVGTFVVQYETTIDGKRVAVTRYDSAHGRPHQDILNRRGDVVEKHWHDDKSAAEVLNLANQDFRDNWERYLDQFLEDRP